MSINPGSNICYFGHCVFVPLVAAFMTQHFAQRVSSKEIELWRKTEVSKNSLSMEHQQNMFLWTEYLDTKPIIDSVLSVQKIYRLATKRGTSTAALSYMVVIDRYCEYPWKTGGNAF